MKDEKTVYLENNFRESEHQYLTQKIAYEKEIAELKSDVLQGAKINEETTNQLNFLNLQNENLNKSLQVSKED